MPDGSIDVVRSAEAPLAGDGGGFQLDVFLRTRRGLFAILAAVAGVGLLSTLVLNFSPRWGWSLVNDEFLAGIDSWAWFAAATCLLWLPLVLMLLDVPDNMAKGPRLGLPVATLSILTVLAGISMLVVSPVPFTVSSAATRFQLPASGAVLTSFFAFFATALLARVWNAALFANYANGQFKARQQEAAEAGDNVETKKMLKEVAAHRKEQGNAQAISALIGTVIVVGIGVFATFAGGWTESTRIGRGFGLATAAIVIGIFAVVLLMDWLAELGPVKAIGRGLSRASHYFAFLAHFYNCVDMLLVRIGAHVAGAAHSHGVARYGVLTATQLCLLTMTWFLPDPLGLVPGFVGLILAISVSRLWAWVEEDRNLALITQFNPSTPRRVGFKEDYKDEAIFGFMFVLLLIPMALKQADAGALFQVPYFENADHEDPVPWFIYFCFELAKALPVVDWADIYLDPSNFDTLKPTDPWGQHATFIARALVDLVLVASLLQAINVTLRNRQQKSLYAARQINRLDVMVESEELRKAVAQPEEHWFRTGLNFRHYNVDRLRELHSDTTADPRRKRYIERIFEESQQSIGYAFEVLEKLGERRASATDLRNTFATVQHEHAKATHLVQPMDLQNIFRELRGVEGLKDFKLALVDFANRIGSIERPDARPELAQLLEFVIFGKNQDQQIYTRVHAGTALTAIVPHLADPDQVSTLLAKLKAARSDLFGAKRRIWELLEGALVMRLREIGPPNSDG